MRISLAVVALALLLSGCETARQDRQLGGALIGGAAGATIGGLASRSTGGALAGGLIGAVAGTIIADETRPRGRCYARTASGKRVRVRC
jgi:predicted small secreted protein